MPSKIFIIAGEQSGDNLGGKLLKQVKQLSPNIDFSGIGGQQMQAQGLTSLFPMSEISLMGFWEIVPHLPKLLRRITQTVNEIIKQNPDTLITIDSPGFNYRVAAELRKKGFKGRMIHYVAPSVWAYKEKRAEKTANLFDEILCILPWEPPYFKQHGMKAHFIGHPIFEDFPQYEESTLNQIREQFNLHSDDIIISILPGSRKGEVDRLLPIFADSIKLLQKKYTNLKPLILGTYDLENHLKGKIKGIENNILITDPEVKNQVLHISNSAIVKSGTISLEVSAAKCPHVICYKISSISAWLMKQMVKVNYANLINISANSEIIPELIQEKCTSKNISKEVINILENPEIAEKQINFSQKEIEKITQTSPSKVAANIILNQNTNSQNKG